MIRRDKLGRFRTSIKTPFMAGYDSEIKGADTVNCHFAWFSTPERLAQWQAGVEAAREALEKHY